MSVAASRWRWAGRDAVAGVSITALLVPAGVAYAQASGLPPVTGLYATILPLLAYAVFGPSRVLILGPDSALIALISTTVLPLAHGDSGRAVELASILALLTGGVCLVAGAARLGFVAELLSKPVRYGYIHGLVLVVVLEQLPGLLGLSGSGDGVISSSARLVTRVRQGSVDTSAALVGILGLCAMLGLRRLAPRVPALLLVVAGASLAVGLGLTPHLATVGVLPQGLPAPALPGVTPGELGTLATAALAIALMTFTDTSALSRTLADREGRVVSPNRELLALGAVNIASGLFRGFPVSSSGSRTPVAISSGARTRLAGVVAAAAIAVLLVAAPWLFRWLPRVALAAVVISSMLILVDVRGLRRILVTAPSEFALLSVCFAGVVLLGVVPGVGIAVGASLMDVIRHSWRPHVAVLGRVPGMKGYHDIARHANALQVPGLLLMRWDAPLFFANAEHFRDHVHALVRSAPPPLRWVVVAAEPITDVDSTAADILEALLVDFDARGVTLAFAEMKGPVKDTLRLFRLFERVGASRFFPTVGEAVRTYVETERVDWRDPLDVPATRAS